MTRNQLTNAVKNLSTTPIFTVDINGAILPTDAQSVDHGGNLLIQPSDPSATSHWQGYVCAWKDSACRCAALISNLGGEAHMKINNTAYTVTTTAPAGDYTLYGTTSESGGSGPTPFASVGDIHVGNGG